MRYGGRITGKRLFRVREAHVADHLIPLMRKRAEGAAKLDLVLRGIALQEAHAGARAVGLVLPQHSYEEVHDLARAPVGMGTAPPDLDAARDVVKLKRKWVGEQLARLEQMKLVRREERPGKRPTLIVLKDDGTGEPLDDPDGTPGNTYITILGSVIASGKLAEWGVPAVSGYLAAMAAERQDPEMQARRTRPKLGEGRWFRAAGWFADTERMYGPPARVKLPFAVPTLERGFHQLRDEDLLSWQRTVTDPRGGGRRRLSGPRNIYRNRFGRLEAQAELLDSTAYTAELEDTAPDE
jgi:hypothetical protein